MLPIAPKELVMIVVISLLSRVELDVNIVALILYRSYYASDVRTVISIGSDVGVQAHIGKPTETDKSFFRIVQYGVVATFG